MDGYTRGSEFDLQADARFPGSYFKWTDEQREILKNSCFSLRKCTSWGQLSAERQEIAENLSPILNKSVDAIIGKMVVYKLHYDRKQMAWISKRNKQKNS